MSPSRRYFVWLILLLLVLPSQPISAWEAQETDSQIARFEETEEAPSEGTPPASEGVPAEESEPEIKGEAEFFRLEEQIITSASKYAQRITESPSAISVITKEDIQKSGAKDITDLFRFYPGTMVVESSSLTRDVILRGFPQAFSPRILVLWDGIPLYTPMFSGVQWQYYPFSLPSIERIEIIRGASSTLYGANAFSGVINIISKKIDKKQSVYTYGSGGNLEFTQEEVLWSRPISDRVRLRLGGLFRHDNGYGANNGDDQGDGQTGGHLNVDMEFDLSDDTNLDFYGYGKLADLNESFTGVFRNVDQDLYTITTGFRLNHNFSDHQNLSFQTSFQEQKSQFVALGALDDSFQRREVNSDLQYTHRFGERDVLVSGANFRYGGYNGHTLTKPSLENMNLMSAFVNNDFKIFKNLILTTGGRYEFDTFTRNQFSGRGNLTYIPFKDQALRVSVARAVRTPSVVEERLSISAPATAPFPPGTVANFSGNNNLKPETVLAAEFGYLGHFLQNRLNAGLQFYFNDVKNLIVQGLESVDLGATPPQVNLAFDNRGDGRVYGIETEFGYQVFEWWKTAINYTLTRQSGFETGRFPKNLASYKNRFAFKNGFSTEFLFNWSSPYTFFDPTTNLSSSVGHIFRLDARVAKKFYKDRFEIAAVGQNLIDTPHTEGDPVNRVDRLFYGMLSFTY